MLFLLAALVCMVHLIFYIQGKQMMDASLGIIGGADGPTAIFVSSVPSGLELLFVSVFVLAAAGKPAYTIRLERNQKVADFVKKLGEIL